MEIFSKIFSSMFSQNLIGWIVIFSIITMFILGVIASIRIKSYYKNLNNDLKVGMNGTDKVYFNNDGLNKIVEEFLKSTSAGIDNINTEVIIEKNISEKIVKLQSLSKLIPATLIGLGLLGTFLGLTLAIFETKSALNGIENINTFSTALQDPIASMATAFWTSIFGVVTSIILNFINQSINFYKFKFYDEVENYLDNELFAMRAKTFNTIFEEFSITVKTTMLTLTEEMTILFKNGVQELVSKINSNSLDLTNSANALKDYTGKFKELVGEMDNTVKNFNEPVDNFKESVKDFIVVSEGLENNFNESFSKFDNSIVGLDGSMNLLANNMDNSFNKVSETIDSTFTKVTEKLDGSLSKVSENIDNTFNSISSDIDETFNKATSNIETTFDKVSSSMENSFNGLNNKLDENFNNLTGNMESIFIGAASNMANIINNGTENVENTVLKVSEKIEVTSNNLSKNLENNFNKLSGDMGNSLENFAGNINKSIINTENDFNNSMKEVAVEISSSFNGLENRIALNNNNLITLIDIVKKEGALTEVRANTLNGLINTINRINELRDNENAEQIEMLREAYGEFVKVVESFKGSLGVINSSIANELAKALDSKLSEIGNEFSNVLSKDIAFVVKDLNESTENLNESVAIVGELVKASNDWASAVAYSLNEVGSDGLR